MIRGDPRIPNDRQLFGTMKWFNELVNELVRPCQLTLFRSFTLANGVSGIPVISPRCSSSSKERSRSLTGRNSFWITFTKMSIVLRSFGKLPRRLGTTKQALLSTKLVVTSLRIPTWSNFFVLFVEEHSIKPCDWVPKESRFTWKKFN